MNEPKAEVGWYWQERNWVSVTEETSSLCTQRREPHAFNIKGFKPKPNVVFFNQKSSSLSSSPSIIISIINLKNSMFIFGNWYSNINVYFWLYPIIHAIHIWCLAIGSQQSGFPKAPQLTIAFYSTIYMGLPLHIFLWHTWHLNSLNYVTFIYLFLFNFLLNPILVVVGLCFSHLLFLYVGVLVNCKQ